MLNFCVCLFFSANANSYSTLEAFAVAFRAFIGNIVWTIITKNEAYKLNHNGEDMPFVANFKNIFGIK